jgi:hypothetical protein
MRGHGSTSGGRALLPSNMWSVHETSQYLQPSNTCMLHPLRKIPYKLDSIDLQLYAIHSRYGRTRVCVYTAGAVCVYELVPY